MKTVLYWAYLLVCCGAAESFTETLVDLGQNVTLKCEVGVSDVYWFLMKPSEPPVFILRSLSSTILDPHYSITTSRKTFSVQYNSSLFIHNISTDELGVYYCIQTKIGLPPNISSGIRLYIRNHTAENQIFGFTNKHCETSPRMTLIILAIMNAALAVAVTVITALHCRKTAKTGAQIPDPDVQPCQDSPSLVYSEVQLTTVNTPVRTNNLNSTYALLKPRTRDPD